MQADLQALEEVEEIGERIGESVITYFQNPRNREMLQQLKKHGVQLGNEIKT